MPSTSHPAGVVATSARRDRACSAQSAREPVRRSGRRSGGGHFGCGSRTRERAPTGWRALGPSPSTLAALAARRPPPRSATRTRSARVAASALPPRWPSTGRDPTAEGWLHRVADRPRRRRRRHGRMGGDGARPAGRPRPWPSTPHRSTRAGGRAERRPLSVGVIRSGSRPGLLDRTARRTRTTSHPPGVRAVVDPAGAVGIEQRDDLPARSAVQVGWPTWSSTTPTCP